MSAEITQIEGVSVTLIGGGGGIFEIRHAGEILWKKVRSGVFPEVGEISELLNKKQN